jgi:hypothetical protein
MEIRTFTSFWKMERKVYSIQDVALPMPISLTVLGVFALVAVPWFFLMFLIKMPFAPPIGYIIWLAPPIAVAYFGSRPIFQGKTLFQFTKSQLRFLLENKAYKVGLQPDLEQYNTEPIVFSAQALTRIDRPLPFAEELRSGGKPQQNSSIKTTKASTKRTKPIRKNK